MDPGVSTAGKMAVDDFDAIGRRMREIRQGDGT